MKRKHILPVCFALAFAFYGCGGGSSNAREGEQNEQDTVVMNEEMSEPASSSEEVKKSAEELKQKVEETAEKVNELLENL